MSDVFVAVWLSLGGLATLVGVVMLAAITRNRSVSLVPMLTLGAFAVTTVQTAERGWLSCAALSALAWLGMWIVVIAGYLAVAYAQHRSTLTNITH